MSLNPSFHFILTFLSVISKFEGNDRSNLQFSHHTMREHKSFRARSKNKLDNLGTKKENKKRNGKNDRKLFRSFPRFPSTFV
jgi:hypothetical protein